jgi:Tol biopolymer transport system component
MHPTWSPDGLRIAYMSWRNGRSEIFTGRSDGSDPQLVVTMPTGDAIDPQWSPDGEYIAFAHAPGGAGNGSAPEGARVVYVVDLSTGRLSRVSR